MICCCDWPWPTIWTAVGSIGTVVAVVLALFQNRVQKWWKRKDITLFPINPRIGAPSNGTWDFFLKIDHIKETLRDSKFALVKFKLHADSEWEHIPPTPFVWEKDRDVVHIFTVKENNNNNKTHEIKLDGYPNVKIFFNMLPTSLGVQIRADDFISKIWILNFTSAETTCGYKLELETPT